MTSEKSEVETVETETEQVEGKTELSSAIDKLNNHLSAMRRKDEITPEALEQVDKHLARLEALKEAKAEPEKESKKETSIESDTNDRIALLEQELAKSRKEVEVSKVVEKYGLTTVELETIRTDDIELLEKRAEMLKTMVENSKRQKVISVPEDLKQSATANRLLNS